MYSGDGVEREDGSARANVYTIVLGRVREILKLGMHICKLGMYIRARTIARIQQHADKEHSELDPNIPM